jgi:hypothetical protein
MPTTMKLIAKTSLGSDASNIEFTSIPGTYTDLVLISSLRSDRAEVDDQVLLTINGNTASITERYLYGAGSGTVLSGTSPANYMGSVSGGTSTSSTFGSQEIYFPNYAGSTNKSFSASSVSEHNGTNGVLTAVAGLWSNTAAITSLKIAPGLGTVWKSGSSSYLYGILKA